MPLQAQVTSSRIIRLSAHSPCLPLHLSQSITNGKDSCHSPIVEPGRVSECNPNPSTSNVYVDGDASRCSGMLPSENCGVPRVSF